MADEELSSVNVHAAHSHIKDKGVTWKTTILIQVVILQLTLPRLCTYAYNM